MYFVIEKDRMEEADFQRWEQSQNGVALFSGEEWANTVSVKVDYFLEKNKDNIRFCKLESYSDFLFGTLHIPHKGEYKKSDGFAFYILEDKLVFIDDTNIVHSSIEKVLSGKLRKGYNLEHFLYDFLSSLIEEDILYLAELEKSITKMEESILAGNDQDFNVKMLKLKKEISRLYRYYSQLTDLGESLYETKREFFGESDADTFRIFADRASRLQGETQALRDYSMQVQEVYQSEIGIRQNNVMKVLTIVTTVFLPLTLIVGWYGMNFSNMPELTWKYGYLMVIIVSVLIVLVCVVLFKKKKFW
ncbi:MAG: CorA family divalent cation transporter [Aminipila sp.]